MDTMLTIVNYFLWFILYSVIGWIIETLLFAVRDKKSVKRGFLFGPLCPIYGTGAVLCTLVLYGRVTNFFALFGVGLVLCTVIEYITHFVLEKAFHATWWDYSNQRFNIKGRICLVSSLLFGAGVAVLLKFIQPFVENVTGMIPPVVRYIAAFVIYSILIIDVAITIQSLKNIVDTLKEIQNFIISETQEGIDKADEKVDEIVEHIKAMPSPEEKIDEIASKIRNNEHINNITERLELRNENAKFIMTRFPRLKLVRYKEALEYLFSHNQNRKNNDSADKNNKDNK